MPPPVMRCHWAAPPEQQASAGPISVSLPLLPNSSATSHWRSGRTDDVLYDMKIRRQQRRKIVERRDRDRVGAAAAGRVPVERSGIRTRSVEDKIAVGPGFDVDPIDAALTTVTVPPAERSPPNPGPEIRRKSARGRNR